MPPMQRTHALVTGGTGSLGAAVCERLLKEGFAVVAADVTREPRAPMPTEVDYLQLDVRSAASAAEVAAEVAARGPLAVLVNGHGVLLPTPPEALGGAAFDEVLDVNLAGTARMCGAAARHLADGGSIVTLSSICARIGRLPGSAAYAASKAGVEALTRSLACALAPRLRVNAVGVGFVEVPMRGAGGRMRAAAAEQGSTTDGVPLDRLATAADIAGAVAFLVSPDAAYVTGTTLMVDGGVTAR